MLKKTIPVLLLILIIPSLFPFFLDVAQANPTYEDFTTYTVVEPDDRIQVTATHVDIHAERDEDAYVYKNMGSIDDFNLFFDTLCEDFEASGSLAYVFMFSNDTDDAFGQRNGENKYLGVDWNIGASGLQIRLGYWDGSSYIQNRSGDDYGVWLSLDSTYYC